MASAVQLACGVFAIATPVLLAAGYYAQVLLDRLGDGRDLFVIALTTIGGLIGEAAALIGLLRPGRAWEAVAALGTAVSAAGVVLVPLYALRLRARRRARFNGSAQPARGAVPAVRGKHPPAHRSHPHSEMRSAPPWGGADRDDFGYRR